MTHVEIMDIRSLSLTAASSAAVERFDALIDDIYYYRLGTGDRLDALLQEFPEFVLAHVLKGYSLMTEYTLDAQPRARAHLLQAEALPANPRERLHQEALRAWIAQDLSARAAAWEQILVEWPLDLLALRQHTGTLFWTGDKRHQAEVSAGVAGHWGPRTPGYGHFLSAHAFAMEEVGQYEVAERCAREALALQPQDLWALHGLVHVFEMQGRVPEGIELLSDAARFLNDYNLFRGHLWWHLSLFKFLQGRFDEVLDLFDREVYPKSSTFYIDVQNGASLLARLEFQGVDVGLARWERLAQASLLNATQQRRPVSHAIDHRRRCGSRTNLPPTGPAVCRPRSAQSPGLRAGRRCVAILSGRMPMQRCPSGIVTSTANVASLSSTAAVVPAPAIHASVNTAASSNNLVQMEWFIWVCPATKLCHMSSPAPRLSDINLRESTTLMKPVG